MHNVTNYFIVKEENMQKADKNIWIISKKNLIEKWKLSIKEIIVIIGSYRYAFTISLFWRILKNKHVLEVEYWHKLKL